MRRQTTPDPGGLINKGTKRKRARIVPLIGEVRDLVAGAAREPLLTAFIPFALASTLEQVGGVNSRVLLI